MHWIDVTVPMRPGMAAYPGDPAVEVDRTAALADGDAYNLTRLTMGTHAGTHVDAPAHFIADGPTIDAIDVQDLIGPAVVADATSARDHIDATALAALDIPPDCARVILKTTNSELWRAPAFTPDYIALTDDGARWLVARGVQLIAIDYLSIAPFADPTPVHRTLLTAGVIIVEGLDLRAVDAGDYTLVCLPLLIPGADGAPARVLLGHEDGQH
ncbi:MAG: cyclase family protein [Chloroflexi bacterium]|nr:cyclase family protein [Chloroflexota bacterium]